MLELISTEKLDADELVIWRVRTDTPTEGSRRFLREFGSAPDAAAEFPDAIGFGQHLPKRRRTEGSQFLQVPDCFSGNGLHHREIHPPDI